MKKTIMIMMGIFLLATASAISIYSGECSSIDLSGLDNPEDLIYTVVGNSSNVDGMTLVNDGTSIEVCFDLLYESDNFTLVFVDKLTKEIIIEVPVSSSCGSGGSSTKTIYLDRNITEYVEVDKIVYVDNVTETEDQNDEVILQEEKIGFFKKIWNWIKGIFTKD